MNVRKLNPIFVAAFVVIALGFAQILVYYNNPSGATSLIPPAPQPVSSTLVDDTTVKLTWRSTSSTLTSYNLYNYDNKAGMVLLSKNIPGTATTYTLTGLPPNTSYRFYLTAVQGYYESSNAGFRDISTPVAASSKPAIPTNLKAWVLGNTAISVSWVDAASNASTSYVLQTDTTTGTSRTITYSSPTLAGRGFVTATNLVIGHTYTFKAKGANSLGESDYSQPLTYIHSSVPAGSVPANPIPSAVNSVTDTSITFSWRGNDSSATGYKVYFTTPNSTYILASDALPTQPTTFTARGLKPLTTYRFFVSALKGQYESAVAPAAEATTLASSVQGIPSQPTTLQGLVIADTAVRLIWKDNSPNESSFSLYQKDNTTGEVKERQVMTNSNPSDLGNSIAFNLISGHSYSFKVKAVNSAGQSGYSNTYTINPSKPPILVSPTPTATTHLPY